MKTLFFPRLAINGIKNNKKLYFPYILSCIGMVMMFYIIHSLSYSPLLREVRGGSSIEAVLSLGKFVIAVFGLLFLFYTNSFLVKKRYKEFGLYNILGMDKNSISRIILCESVTLSLIGLICGIGLGIGLSKFAELGMLNVIHREIDYRFTVTSEAVLFTVLIFGIIFLLLTVKSLIQVRHLKPLQLLKSENAGEKPIKANWVFALLGVIILGVAYYIAVSIKTPLSALITFFVAVIMVIIATYLLFMSGSVALCKILQKNKKYYYKKQHFISVSSMAYRMKRNGAGLASICILSTMVLVMLSSTTSLYFGKNDALNTRFPRNTEIEIDLQSIDNLNEEKCSIIREKYKDVFKDNNFTPKNVYEYRCSSITGKINKNKINVNASADSIVNYDDIRMLYFISVKDYNKIMDTNLSLKAGQAYLCAYRCTYNDKSIDIGGLKLHIVKTLDNFIDIGESKYIVSPSLMFIIPDYETLRPLDNMVDISGYKALSNEYYYGYDYDTDDETAIDIFRKQVETIDTVDFIKNDGGYGYSAGCIALEKDDFYTTYGGMFFLGIMLSVLFIFAATMIIYYKQLSEGYEDKARFDIMQKVGMTKQDIKKSINSQILTVFFAPLIFAGLHLGFAFPLVWKILQLFNLSNLKFIILVTIGAYLCFGIFYAIIYKITAKVYYSIVAN